MQRQLHVKDGTVRLTPGERKIASVREHDLLGDRQAEARSVLLRRLEESEDLDFIGDPGPAVLDGDAQPRGVRDGRRKLDLAGTVADRLEGVLDEVVEHAMELAPVRLERHQGLTDLGAQRDVARARRRMPEPYDVVEKPGNVDGVALEPLLAREREDVANHRL